MVVADGGHDALGQAPLLQDVLGQLRMVQPDGLRLVREGDVALALLGVQEIIGDQLADIMQQAGHEGFLAMQRLLRQHLDDGAGRQPDCGRVHPIAAAGLVVVVLQPQTGQPLGADREDDLLHVLQPDQDDGLGDGVDAAGLAVQAAVGHLQEAGDQRLILADHRLEILGREEFAARQLQELGHDGREARQLLDPPQDIEIHGPPAGGRGRRFLRTGRHGRSAPSESTSGTRAGFLAHDRPETVRPEG